MLLHHRYDLIFLFASDSEATWRGAIDFFCQCSSISALGNVPIVTCPCVLQAVSKCDLLARIHHFLTTDQGSNYVARTTDTTHTKNLKALPQLVLEIA